MADFPAPISLPRRFAVEQVRGCEGLSRRPWYRYRFCDQTSQRSLARAGVRRRRCGRSAAVGVPAGHRRCIRQYRSADRFRFGSPDLPRVSSGWSPSLSQIPTSSASSSKRRCGWLRRAPAGPTAAGRLVPTVSNMPAAIAGSRPGTGCWRSSARAATCGQAVVQALQASQGGQAAGYEYTHQSARIMTWPGGSTPSRPG